MTLPAKAGPILRPGYHVGHHRRTGSTTRIMPGRGWQLRSRARWLGAWETHQTVMFFPTYDKTRHTKSCCNSHLDLIRKNQYPPTGENDSGNAGDLQTNARWNKKGERCLRRHRSPITSKNTFFSTSSLYFRKYFLLYFFSSSSNSSIISSTESPASNKSTPSLKCKSPSIDSRSK